MIAPSWRLLAVAAFCAALAPWLAQADQDLESRASWSAPDEQDVRRQVDAWLATVELDTTRRRAIDSLWAVEEPTDPASLLSRVLETAAAADDQARRLVEFCASDPGDEALPQFEALASEALPAFVKNNLRLALGQWLAQHRYYDEALEVMKPLATGDVVDPASLLFHQSVCYHKLRMKEECLPTVARLLEREQDIPQRYAVIARLIDADIRPLKADSLDEVARLMDNIERVLGLGRAGAKVRKEEDDVIAKLDKMIDELEKQRQQQQQQQAGGAANPSTPAQESANLGGRGEGNVDPKRISNKDDWGNLPDKEREEALQPVLEELPAHYRKAIEEYLRRLARDGAD